MTTHRRYYFVYPEEWTGGRYFKVKAVLESACLKHWWYRDPQVQGEAFNRMLFAFTVSARDRWWCHQRAMDLAERVCRAIKMKPVPQPTWQPLPPHTNRSHPRPWPGMAPVSEDKAQV